MNVRILLADDHRIVRDGLRALIETQPNMEVIGESDNGRDALRLAKESSPDLVVMDLSMPGLNGIETTRRILSEVEGVRVVVLSMHSDKRFVHEALRAGASGYLLKDSAFEELAQAVATVMRGQSYLSPAIAGIVVDAWARDAQHEGTEIQSVLTPREREVLQLLAEGRNTKQIAAALSVSAKTIETHRRRIMKKLGLHSVAELTKYAIREGLTTIDP